MFLIPSSKESNLNSFFSSMIINTSLSPAVDSNDDWPLVDLKEGKR